MTWKLPFGANVERDGTHFRIWAPDASAVDVVIERGARAMPHAMHRGTGGYHHTVIAGIGDGACYRFAIGGVLYPDPASRSQPEGAAVSGPTSSSRFIAPRSAPSQGECRCRPARLLHIVPVAGRQTQGAHGAGV